MDQNGTAQRWLRGLAVAALGLTVAACDQIEGFEVPAFLSGGNADTGPTGLAPANEATGETRDVEAPEVFQKTEAGLWDGRPSLGGVWVAHPDVGDPERVIIRNEENGRFVTGALFRRERDNPGPTLQVSSDAAEELGMLAGAPARLNVTALRREAVAPAAPVVTEDAALPNTDVALSAPAAIEATPLDAASDVAAAAPAVADTAAAAMAPIVTAPASEAATGTIAAIAAAGAAAAAAVPAGPPLSAIDVPLPEPAPVAAVPVAPSAAASGSTIDAIAGAAAAVAAAEAEAGIAAPAAVESPLDARTDIAAPVPLPEPVTSGLEKPFIQVGIFSVESGANDAADTLRGDGISASVVQQDGAGTVFWRVLVGPAPTAQDRTAILAKVQALGFNDAYFVSN